MCRQCGNRAVLVITHGKVHRREDSTRAAAGGNVEIVCDSGVGIPRPVLQRCFQIRQRFARYYAPHSAASVNAEDAGLLPRQENAIANPYNGAVLLLRYPKLLLIVAEE